MRASLSAIFFAVLLLLISPQMARPTMIDSVDPTTAKAGDVVTATGTDIGSEQVTEVYLTSGGTDLKVEVVEQTAKSLKFKVPAAIKAGRWALLINVKQGEGRALMELPVKITVK